MRKGGGGGRNSEKKIKVRAGGVSNFLCREGRDRRRQSRKKRNIIGPHADPGGTKM